MSVRRRMGVIVCKDGAELQQFVTTRLQQGVAMANMKINVINANYIGIT